MPSYWRSIQQGDALRAAFLPFWPDWDWLDTTKEVEAFIEVKNKVGQAYPEIVVSNAQEFLALVEAQAPEVFDFWTRETIEEIAADLLRFSRKEKKKIAYSSLIFANPLIDGNIFLHVLESVNGTSRIHKLRTYFLFNPVAGAQLRYFSFDGFPVPQYHGTSHSTYPANILLHAMRDDVKQVLSYLPDDPLNSQQVNKRLNLLRFVLAEVQRYPADIRGTISQALIDSLRRIIEATERHLRGETDEEQWEDDVDKSWRYADLEEDEPPQNMSNLVLYLARILHGDEDHSSFWGEFFAIHYTYYALSHQRQVECLEYMADFMNMIRRFEVALEIPRQVYMLDGVL